MKVYEAIKASPIGVAWHNEKEIVARNVVADVVRANPDGWQPLYTSPPEYTLGEPLTEATCGQRYIAIRSGEVDQGVFASSYQFDSFDADWTYYADPRPLPKLPEVKEQEAWFFEDDLQTGTYKLTAEGAARLERLLNESEGE